MSRRCDALRSRATCQRYAPGTQAVVGTACGALLLDGLGVCAERWEDGGGAQQPGFGGGFAHLREASAGPRGGSGAGKASETDGSAK